MILIILSVSLFINAFSYSVSVIVLVVGFSFYLCRPFVVDIVNILVVAVFGLDGNLSLIVSLDSRTPHCGF